MKPELMRYRNDRLSFYMCLLGIAFNVCLLFAIHTSSQVYMNQSDIPAGAMIGADILINIVFMLVTFLAAEKVKTYTMNWCYVCLGLGAVQVIRIFVLALFLGNRNILTGSALALSIVFLVLSAASLFAAMSISMIRSRALKAHLKNIQAEEA